MRILMLSQFYPPILGGMERHVRDLSRELVKRGHDVVVVTLWQQGGTTTFPDYEIRDGVRIYWIRGTIHRAAGILFQDPNRSYAPPLPDPELTRTLHRIVVRERPQIIHAHNWLVYALLPFKKWSGAKLVVTLHEYGLRCPRWTLVNGKENCTGPALVKCFNCLHDHYGLAKGSITLFGNRVMSQVERKAVDMFLPVSQAVAVGNGLTGSHLPYRVIPNFIPDKVEEANGDIETYLSQLPEEGYLLFVGAFGLHKGVDILLQAYGGINTEVPLVLIGYEIPEYSFDSANIPPNVFILKHWPNTAVMEAWRRSNIALTPSKWAEPCPTVVMEAMVTGRPVIGSRIGGIPDIIVDGETGILVPPADPVSLRQAIKQLLDNAELRDRLGRTGKQRVVEFQAGSVIPRIEQVYYDLVAGGKEREC